MDTPTKYLSQLCFLAGSVFETPFATSILKTVSGEMEFDDINLIPCILLAIIGLYFISAGYIIKKGIKL